MNTYGDNFENTVQKANSAYNQGLYDSAIIMYEEVIEAEMESSVLYYNLANAYFKNSNIPKSILYYEKAIKLDPNDEDLLYNLNVANAMIVDKIEKVPTMFYKNWWNYFYNMFSANIWTLISISIWITFLVLFSIFILSRELVLKKLSFYLAVLFFIGSLASFGLASQKYYYTRENKEAIIFTPTITVKSSPTMGSVDLFVVHEGTKVSIIDNVENWYKIKIQDGSIGWLPAETMEMI